VVHELKIHICKCQDYVICWSSIILVSVGGKFDIVHMVLVEGEVFNCLQ